jgi:hypothetical protein
VLYLPESLASVVGNDDNIVGNVRVEHFLYGSPIVTSIPVMHIPIVKYLHSIKRMGVVYTKLPDLIDIHTEHSVIRERVFNGTISEYITTIVSDIELLVANDLEKIMARSSTEMAAMSMWDADGCNEHDGPDYTYRRNDNIVNAIV